jgi:hypothetical protein
MNIRNSIINSVTKPSTERQSHIKLQIANLQSSNNISEINNDIDNIDNIDNIDPTISINLLITYINKIDTDMSQLEVLKNKALQKIELLQKQYNSHINNDDLKLEFNVIGNGKFVGINYVDEPYGISEEHKITILKKDIPSMQSSSDGKQNLFHLHQIHANNTYINYTITYNATNINKDTNSVMCTCHISF